MPTTITGTDGVSQVQDGIVTDEKLALSANSAEVKEALNATGSAPIYACRAWVNFDGNSGTPVVRASGNVSSVTSTSDYFEINFSSPMPDDDFSVVGTSSYNLSDAITSIHNDDQGANTSTKARIRAAFHSGSSSFNYSVNRNYISVAIFR